MTDPSLRGAKRRGNLAARPNTGSELVSALVEAVCLSTPATRVAKAPQDEAFLGPHGFIGDRHEAEYRRGRDGEPLPNLRQWSAVSSEEVAAFCADIGVALFAHGALGENLRLSGVILADVRPGSVLEFPSGARLEVAGQNDPCLSAARELAAAYGAAVERFFVQQAFGRRGVIGRVLAAGPVRRGDVVRLLVPEGERA